MLGLYVCAYHTNFSGKCMSPYQLWSAFMFSPLNAGSLDSFPFVDCVTLLLFSL